jgi:hypothetical protein
MSRALGPRASLTADNAALAWTLIIIFWGLAGLAWLAWAAARLAALAAGHGRVPPFGTRWVSALVHAALSRDRSVRQLAQSPSTEQGIRLRLSLAGARPGRLATADIGLVLGRLKQPAGDGPELFASWEDTVLAFMGPRSGKTTSLGVPYVLSAPGAVVATSIKADLWAVTAELRAASGSRIWAFDPQAITAAGQRFWVNMHAGLASVEAANRLAGHFVLTIDDSSKRDIWGPAAQELITSLLLAAASSGRTLHAVSRWLDDPATPTPAELLDDAGYPALASALRGAQMGAPETRDGIYQTARTAAPRVPRPPAPRGLPHDR